MINKKKFTHNKLWAVNIAKRKDDRVLAKKRNIESCHVLGCTSHMTVYV